MLRAVHQRAKGQQPALAFAGMSEQQSCTFVPVCLSLSRQTFEQVDELIWILFFCIN